MLLNKSAPPTTDKRPNKTTICMNNFCLDGKIFDRNDNTKTGSPKKVGIIEVIELLSLKCVTPSPHTTRKIPKIMELSIALNPMNLYGCDILSDIRNPLWLIENC